MVVLKYVLLLFSLVDQEMTAIEQVVYHTHRSREKGARHTTRGVGSTHEAPGLLGGEQEVGKAFIVVSIRRDVGDRVSGFRIG